MTAPAGTFLADVRDGLIHLPSPIRNFCEVKGWTLFRLTTLDHDRLEIHPILPGDQDDVTEELCCCLSAEGQLWIPAAMRESVTLGDQMVMVRIEQGSLRVYLRRVFDTLGFRP
jgi:hypothetical protein